MRKFKKIEKIIIAMSDDNYNTYDCEKHGVFQKRKDDDDNKCPYQCNGHISKINNINDLREKFLKDLNLKK